MNKEKIRAVYKITNLINNKIYVGESLDIDRRWKDHTDDLNNNKHINYKLQEEWNIYGESAFKFEVIEELNKDIARYIDQYVLIIYEDKYIKTYNSIEEGYNIEDTLKEILEGNKTINVTDSIEKSKNTLKQVLKNIEDNNGIYFVNPKILEKRKTEENLKKKVYCLEKDKMYKNIKNASKECKVFVGNVYKACNSGGGKATLKNGSYLTFIFEEDYNN